MAVLTGGREIRMSAEGHTYRAQAVADTYFKGAAVVVNAAGNAHVQGGASGVIFAGFPTYDQTVAANEEIELRYPTRAFLPGAAAALADVGSLIYASTDDETFSTVATDATIVGWCFKAVVGVGWWVRLAHATP